MIEPESDDKFDETFAKDSNVNSNLMFWRRNNGISFSEFPNNEYKGPDK